MPVNTSLAKSLKNQYGSKAGEGVYYAMENKGDPAFKKGLATAKKEGHTVAHMKQMKPPKAQATSSRSSRSPNATGPKAPPKMKATQQVTAKKARVGKGADSLGYGDDDSSSFGGYGKVKPAKVGSGADKPQQKGSAPAHKATGTGSPIGPRAMTKTVEPKQRTAAPVALRRTKDGAVHRRMGMPVGSKSRVERK